ncbi:MAG: hypothetical protein NZ890_04680 [Myxococcota bacterium]|nr:hypothetical protein [Myxococcota bacterium]
MDAVRRGDLVETARLCWAYLQGRQRGQQPDEAGAGDKRDSATYYLGEALERLGYVHAAIDRYAEIVTERRAPQLVPRALAALERLSRANRHNEEAIAHAGVLSAAEFEELPPLLSSFIHYRQVIDDLRQGHDAWAMRHLERIGPDTPYFPRALYARAVWRLGRNETEAALKDFCAVIDHPQTSPELRARALQQRARMHYNRGLWQQAYADLDKVDLHHVSGSEVLLEKAWAMYHARNFRAALGLLHALGAPSYADRFMPERYLLRSLIFGKYCHFRAAKRSIEMFRQKFANEINALRNGSRPEEVTVLRRAAFERTASTGPGLLEALLVQLAIEKGRVGSERSWGSPAQAGSLNHHLARYYDFKMRGLRFQQAQLLRTASEQVASELLHANEQMNLLEYEVGLGIYRRISREARMAATGSERRRNIPRISDEIYFHFDGEYWTDELPDMQFFIEDRCVD